MRADSPVASTSSPSRKSVFPRSASRGAQVRRIGAAIILREFSRVKEAGRTRGRREDEEGELRALRRREGLP